MQTAINEEAEVPRALGPPSWGIDGGAFAQARRASNLAAKLLHSDSTGLHWPQLVHKQLPDVDKAITGLTVACAIECCCKLMMDWALP